SSHVHFKLNSFPTRRSSDLHAPRTANRLGFRLTIEHSYGDAKYTTITYYLLPNVWSNEVFKGMNVRNANRVLIARKIVQPGPDRSEEHTSELQSRENRVCRL